MKLESIALLIRTLGPAVSQVAKMAGQMKPVAGIPPAEIAKTVNPVLGELFTQLVKQAPSLLQSINTTPPTSAASNGENNSQTLIEEIIALIRKLIELFLNLSTNSSPGISVSLGAIVGVILANPQLQSLLVDFIQKVGEWETENTAAIDAQRQTTQTALEKSGEMHKEITPPKSETITPATLREGPAPSAPTAEEKPSPTNADASLSSGPTHP